MRRIILSLFLFIQADVSASESKNYLLYGTNANPADYPELLLTTNYYGECTATLIGPSVFITAAHCGADLSTTEFEFKGILRSATLYWVDATDTMDIALGILDSPILDEIFVSVSTEPVSVGDELTLLGFGCYDYYEDPSLPGGWGYLYDRSLRVGTSQVSELNQHWIEISHEQGAVVCSGDSGGPTYSFRNGKKEIVGIHSEADDVTSWDIRLDLSYMKNYFRHFTLTYGVEICGINRDCQ